VRQVSRGPEREGSCGKMINGDQLLGTIRGAKGCLPWPCPSVFDLTTDIFLSYASCRLSAVRPRTW